MMKTTKAKEKTDAFLGKYLVNAEIGKGSGHYLMVSESSGTDKDRIAATIRNMPYREYLPTLYWKLVSLQVKHDAGWQCEICGHKSNLVVHHIDYRWLGYDMYHIDHLQCLCRECHESLHGLRGEKSVSKAEVYSNKANKRLNTRVLA